MSDPVLILFIHGFFDTRFCLVNVRLSIFKSPFGWGGLICHDFAVNRLVFGFPNRDAVEAIFPQTPVADSDCGNRWGQAIQAYLGGDLVDLSQIPVDLSWATRFQESVLLACRSIPRGSVLTYGQLADRAGSPKAFRAVGTIMATNRTPLLIPCHRVVSRTGIGNYSAAKGESTKRQLLAMEQAELGTIRK